MMAAVNDRIDSADWLEEEHGDMGVPFCREQMREAFGIWAYDNITRALTENVDSTASCGAGLVFGTDVCSTATITDNGDVQRQRAGLDEQLVASGSGRCRKQYRLRRTVSTRRDQATAAGPSFCVRR
jgi:hypothetical protein